MYCTCRALRYHSDCRLTAARSVCRWWRHAIAIAIVWRWQRSWVAPSEAGKLRLERCKVFMIYFKLSICFLLGYYWLLKCLKCFCFFFK